MPASGAADAANPPLAAVSRSPGPPPYLGPWLAPSLSAGRGGSACIGWPWTTAGAWIDRLRDARPGPASDQTGQPSAGCPKVDQPDPSAVGPRHKSRVGRQQAGAAARGKCMCRQPAAASDTLTSPRPGGLDGSVALRGLLGPPCTMPARAECVQYIPSWCAPLLAGTADGVRSTE